MGSHPCLKLPPGFRFHPTDEELVILYLKRRVFSIPLPAAIIADTDICKYDPSDLPGDGENEKYFFTRKEAKYPNGSRSNRACASGYWKATGKDKVVHASMSNQVVGMKKTLVFYRGKAPKGTKTEWIMHEYRLSGVGAQPYFFLQKKDSTQIPVEDWVLCRIHFKRSPIKPTAFVQYMENFENVQRPRNPMFGRPVFFDFMRENQRESESSPPTSSITEISSYEASDSDDNSSSNKPFPSCEKKE